MSKFSLSDGVTDSFSFLINPGPLPIGTAANANDHASSTHRLPIPPHDKIKTEHDFSYMYNTVMKFLVESEGSRKIPPLFVETGSKGEHIEAAIKTLDKIVTEGGGNDNFEFRVYPIEQLLFRLQKKCIQLRSETGGCAEVPFLSLPMAKAMFERNPFQYHDIGCDIHREQDNSSHCCLAKVKRWGYRFVQLCLDANRDMLISGKHLPEKTVVGDSETMSLESKDSLWETKLSNTFRAISIDSNTTQKSTCTDSDAPETVSIGSTEITREYAPSTVGTEVKAPSVKRLSYSQLLRLGGKLRLF
jgi:hypothetical protein